MIKKVKYKNIKVVTLLNKVFHQLHLQILNMVWSSRQWLEVFIRRLMSYSKSHELYEKIAVYGRLAYTKGNLWRWKPSADESWTKTQLFLRVDSIWIHIWVKFEKSPLETNLQEFEFITENPYYGYMLPEYIILYSWIF